MIGDVDGASVKSGATITMVLGADGALTFHAVQPAQTVDDSGTWSVSGSTMTITFQQQGLSGDGPYSFDGVTLTIPVKFFSSGSGSSRWTRSGAGSGPAPSGTAGQQPPGADDWKMWDLTQDAGANGYKTYEDARSRGTDQKAAVQLALAAVKAMPDVASAELSDNGYNISISYTDGTSDYVITEQLLTAQEDGSSGPSGLRRAAEPPQAATDEQCATLPGVSSGNKAGLEEPTREGIDPAGGYGVTIYSPAYEPTPLTSADSPPQDERQALLVSPQYDVNMDPPGQPSNSIRESIGHDDMGCVQASLTRAGYRVDTILGSNANGDLAATGELALATMTDDLRHHTYGVFYFAGHGFSMGTGPGTLHGLEFGPIDLSDPAIHDVVGDQVPTNDKPELRHLLAQKLAESLGLAWDAKDPPINIIVGEEGGPVIVVYPEYFEQIQANGASFAHSLVWINACSSAVTYKNGSFPAAMRAAALVGWQYTMSGQLISTVAEEAFDDLADKARTVRAATEWAKIHEVWLEDAVAPADHNVDPKSLVALGRDQKPYPVIDEQTAVFVYYMRNAPSSATADLANNATFVKECLDDYWAHGQAAGIRGPSCQQMQAGGVPTKDEVDDALAEVGASGVPAEPAGRWTLAD